MTEEFIAKEIKDIILVENFKGILKHQKIQVKSLLRIKVGEVGNYCSIHWIILTESIYKNL